MQTVQSFLAPWLVFLAEDPALRMLQISMLLAGFFTIFLVFFTTRDILLRTHSFWYMFVSILLVAGLPVAGFLLYILIRPPRTIKEREMESLLSEVLVSLRKNDRRQQGDKKAGIVKKQRQSGDVEEIAL